MAYTPLSQRVADALRKRGTPDAPHPPSGDSPEKLTALLHKSAPEPPPFQWDTPERTRQMVIRQQAPKKSEGHKMSMAQAMRELRKLRRKPR